LFVLSQYILQAKEAGGEVHLNFASGNVNWLGLGWIQLLEERVSERWMPMFVPAKLVINVDLSLRYRPHTRNRFHKYDESK
jgi:hypothetical protein